jgi:hypothetical protein
VQYDFIAEADSALVRVRAYSIKDKHIVLDHASLETLNGLPAGRYHFIFFVEEREIAELDQVCSPGRIKGCEAQRLGPDAIPLLEFKKSGTESWQVELVRNGLCPAAD